MKIMISVFMAWMFMAFVSSDSWSAVTPPMEEIIRNDGPVLLILAHPDDETCIGGVLGYMKERGVPVYAVYLTRGEGSLTNMVDGNLSHLIDIRPREAQEAARRLGLRGLMQLKEKDVGFYTPGTKEPTHDLNLFMNSHLWDFNRIKSEIQSYAERIQPVKVITLLPSSKVHAHHQAAARISMELFREKRLGRRVRAVYSSPEIDWYPPGYFDGVLVNPVRFPLAPYSPILKQTYAQFQLHAAQANQSQETGHTGLFTNDEILVKIIGH